MEPQQIAVDYEAGVGRETPASHSFNDATPSHSGNDSGTLKLAPMNFQRTMKKLPNFINNLQISSSWNVEPFRYQL